MSATTGTQSSRTEFRSGLYGSQAAAVSVVETVGRAVMVAPTTDSPATVEPLTWNLLPAAERPAWLARPERERSIDGLGDVFRRFDCGAVAGSARGAGSRRGRSRRSTESPARCLRRRADDGRRRYRSLDRRSRRRLRLACPDVRAGTPIDCQPAKEGSAGLARRR